MIPTNVCACEKTPAVETPSMAEAMKMILDLVSRLDASSSRLVYRTMGQTTNADRPTGDNVLQDMGYIFQKLTDVNDRLGRLCDFIG